LKTLSTEDLLLGYYAKKVSPTMLNETSKILSTLDLIPKRLLNVVSSYVGSLAIGMKRHTFRAAADLSGLDESRFCALLGNPETKPMSQAILSRSVRRRLHRLKRIDGKLVFIIDATIVGRKSRHVENVGCHHSGSGLVWGHKFVNFVVLNGNEVIPLESVPVYTKRYARDNGLKRLTEIEIVENWISSFRDRALFSPSELRSAVFLLDAGYDVKSIQRAIKGIGADFVMALKSSRIINGSQVSELFWSTRRWYKNETIRLHVGSGGKDSRRTFSVRTARDANLKGFGHVTVICSKAEDRRARPIKYLATSDLEMSARDVVKWYALRWRIETWHREMKQNFGLIDCRARRFVAIESHVNFSLTAYLLQKESGRNQISIHEYVRQEELRAIQVELTKIGSVTRLRTRISEALQARAA
jgi:hypothetical protein